MYLFLLQVARIELHFFNECEKRHLEGLASLLIPIHHRLHQPHLSPLISLLLKEIL